MEQTQPSVAASDRGNARALRSLLTRAREHLHTAEVFYSTNVSHHERELAALELLLVDIAEVLDKPDGRKRRYEATNRAPFPPGRSGYK